MFVQSRFLLVLKLKSCYILHVPKICIRIMYVCCVPSLSFMPAFCHDLLHVLHIPSNSNFIPERNPTEPVIKRWRRQPGAILESDYNLSFVLFLCHPRIKRLHILTTHYVNFYTDWCMRQSVTYSFINV